MGEIPPPPQELLEAVDQSNKDTDVTKYSTKALKIVYDSPLARAQRLVDVQVIDQVKMSVAQAVQLNPQAGQDLLLRFDMVEMEVDRAKALGLPSKYVVDKTTFDNAKAAQAAQAQQAQGLTKMQQAAEISEKVGNTPGGEQVTKDMFSALGEQMSGAMAG